MNPFGKQLSNAGGFFGAPLSQLSIRNPKETIRVYRLSKRKGIPNWVL
jgi:hypothetical protein